MELVDSSTRKGVNGSEWGEQGQAQNIANARRGLVIWNIGGLCHASSSYSKAQTEDAQPFFETFSLRI